MKRQTQPWTGSIACHAFPRLTREQEGALIERARAGEDVRDQVILSLQQRVHALAAKYARPEEQEEFCDLVNSANVALLKSYTRALSSPNPYAYLLRTAFGQWRSRQDRVKVRHRSHPQACGREE